VRGAAGGAVGGTVRGVVGTVPEQRAQDALRPARVQRADSRRGDANLSRRTRERESECRSTLDTTHDDETTNRTRTGTRNCTGVNG